MKFSELIAIVISKIVNWSHRKNFQFQLKKYSNVSIFSNIGVNSTLSGPFENFYLGDYSYINRGNISWGESSKVIIGSGCAIGYNVSIKAITHSSLKPTNNKAGAIIHIEKNIQIGDDVWIGDNVFIREGISIGRNSIVGANSVVTKSFEQNSIIAGIPAKLIKMNNY